MKDMTFSEAIRLGAMLGPQARGAIARKRRKYIFFGPVIQESCALGAAFHAQGCGQHDEVVTEQRAGFRGAGGAIGDIRTVIEVPDEWSILLWSTAACPVCPLPAGPLFRVIPHLNDTHLWTREAIADWVATIELASRPEARIVAPQIVDTPVA